MMIEIILFLGTLIVALFSIRLTELYQKKNEFISLDTQKKNISLPTSCGIALLLPLWIFGFYLAINSRQLELIAWLLLVSGFSILGFLGDLKVKNKPNLRDKDLPKEKSINELSKKLSSWKLRAIIIAVMSLAFALFFSSSLLLVIPIAFFIALLASFHNTFAGLNGWETGSSLIIDVALLAFLWHTAYFLLGLVLCASAFALFLFNKFPARVFPGDSGTLLLGSGIAGLIILTQRLELALIALLFYIPHAIDYFILKNLISKAKDATQQKIRPYKILPNGKIYIADYPKNKIQWDFAKMLLKLFGPLKEWQVSLIIWLVIAVNSLAVVYFFA